jgi:hypothetical protein
MGNPHYESAKQAHKVPLASIQAEAVAFLRRRTVEPRSHRRVLRPIEEVRS